MNFSHQYVEFSTGVTQPWVEATVQTVDRSGWKFSEGENYSMASALECSWCGSHRPHIKRPWKILGNIIKGTREDKTPSFVHKKNIFT